MCLVDCFAYLASLSLIEEPVLMASVLGTCSRGWSCFTVTWELSGVKGKSF